MTTFSNEGTGVAAVRALEAKPTSLASAGSFDFLDLKAQFAPIREEVMQAITRVMNSQQFILGAELKLFEEEIAAMLEVKHAVTCASGSDALLLALMACEIQAGDEVITTPFTFIATGGSIARTGATPVFVDIDPETFNINSKEIEARHGHEPFFPYIFSACPLTLNRS